MKTLFLRSVCLTVVALIVSIFFVMDAWAGKKIAFLMWDDDARYTDAKEGMLAELKNSGFAPPSVSFHIESAGGNKAKATETAKQIAAAKYDLVLATGTSAAVALAKEIKDVPLVFSMVYDPVDAKIAADWASSGNNTTGSSSQVPMSELVKALKKTGSVKTIGVIYTSGQKNSETQLRSMQEAAQKAQVRVMPISVASKADVASVIPDAVTRVDALYLTGSSVVSDGFDTIVGTATKAKVITFSHLQDQVERGALMGVVANTHAVGRLAGVKAAKVLKGAQPSTIPIEMLKDYELVVNMKTARAGQFNLPADLLNEAKKVSQ